MSRTDSSSFFECKFTSDDHILTVSNCSINQACCDYGCCPKTITKLTDDNKDTRYPWYLWVILADVVIALILIVYFWWRKVNGPNSAASRHHHHAGASYAQPQQAYAANHSSQQRSPVKTHMLFAFRGNNQAKAAPFRAL